MTNLLTITQASQWASEHLKRNIKPSNISYLIQYGRIKKISHNVVTFVNKKALIHYYKESYTGQREINWKKNLGDDLNWHLSFDYLREADTTKHVHRLHPYKGKFIDKWYLHPVRQEIDFMFDQVRQIKDIRAKKIASIILSRTIRSCRSTTHADLATLKEPVTSIYYCKKHGKICKPLFSILSWWGRYCQQIIIYFLKIEIRY